MPPVENQEKERTKSTIARTQRRGIKKKNTTLPQVPETILEVEDEKQGEKIYFFHLIQRTHLAKAIEEERRRISIVTPPSTPREPI